MTLREQINRAKLRAAILTSFGFATFVIGTSIRAFVPEVLRYPQIATLVGLVGLGAGIASMLCFYTFYLHCPSCDRYWGQWLVRFDQHFTIINPNFTHCPKCGYDINAEMSHSPKN